jgi:hypothetical protein
VDKGSRHESTIAHEVMISSTGNIAPFPLMLSLQKQIKIDSMLWTPLERPGENVYFVTHVTEQDNQAKLIVPDHADPPSSTISFKVSIFMMSK